MPITCERHDDGTAVLTLDDPDRRNALTMSLGGELVEHVTRLRDEQDLRAVVLTGTPPAFSGGGDLGMLEDLRDRTRAGGFDAAETMRTFYGRYLALRDLPVPTIAAINGHAIGAGLCVALACDIRVVSTDARMGLNFSRLGLHPGMGATWLLPRIVGPMQAADLLYTGRLVTGGEAVSRGLALEACGPDEVLPRALELAGEIAAASPVVVRQLKRILAVTPDCDLSSALATEAAAQAVTYGTDDLVEGLTAARERRPPSFPGR